MTTNKRKSQKVKIIKGERIAEQLTEWGTPCVYESHTIAPQVIHYNLTLQDATKIAKAKRLAEPLAIWADTPATITTSGKYLIIELQRKQRQFISLNEWADTLAKAKPHSLAIGTDTTGEQITATLDDVTHLLIAGTTGGGKSVILNNIILSLCAYNKPQRLKMFLFDAKRVEFNKFKSLPHLANEIITEPTEAAQTLKFLVDVMEQRYKILESKGLDKAGGHFAKIVVIVDELTDLVQQSPQIKPLLTRLLQKARACGIHLILATQSPRASILDGVTLANLPTRLALKCATARESVLILGHKGAEQLTGKGDAIYKAQNTTNEKRIQAPFLTDDEIKTILK